MDTIIDSEQPGGLPSIDALLAADTGAMADDELRQHLLALHRAVNRVGAATVEATGRFDRRGLHRGDGARSAPSWLAGRVDQTRGRCAADVHLARDLRETPLVEAASRTGRLGRAKVELLIGVRTPEVVGPFADCEATLVAEVERRSVAAAAAYLRGWHEQARLAVGWHHPDEPVDDDEPPKARFDLSTTFDGRAVVDGELDAENGTILRSALDAEIDELFRLGFYGPHDDLTPGERRGLALINIISRRAKVGMKHDRPRPAIEVIVDERTLLGVPITDPLLDGGADLLSRVRQTVEGLDISDRTLRRLLCNADVHRIVVNADGEVLDVGKDERTATRAQRRALRFHHRGCGFPGCDAPFDWCEAHHIDPWDPDPGNDRGRTDLDNLIPLCRFHHDQVHAGRFRLRIVGGEVVVERPPDPREGGRRRPITPTRPRRRPAA